MDLLAPEFTPKRTFLEMIRRIPQSQGRRGLHQRRVDDMGSPKSGTDMTCRD